MNGSSGIDVMVPRQSSSERERQADLNISFERSFSIRVPIEYIQGFLFPVGSARGQTNITNYAVQNWVKLDGQPVYSAYTECSRSLVQFLLYSQYLKTHTACPIYLTGAPSTDI